MLVTKFKAFTHEQTLTRPRRLTVSPTVADGQPVVHRDGQLRPHVSAKLFGSSLHGDAPNGPRRISREERVKGTRERVKSAHLWGRESWQKR